MYDLFNTYARETSSIRSYGFEHTLVKPRAYARVYIVVLTANHVRPIRQDREHRRITYLI